MRSSELQDFLDLRAEMPTLKPGDPMPDIETRRRGFDASIPPAQEDVRAVPVTVNEIPCEWVLAPGAANGRRLLYLHGGGYSIGSIRSHRRIAADLSRASGCAVLNVDYRLAPENTCPAQLEDAHKTFAWLRENGPTGVSEAQSMFVAGDSAGGGLTLALLISLRDNGLAQPAAAATFSAWTDMTASGASVKTRARRDPIIGTSLALGTAAASFLGTTDARSPKASPVFADFTGSAPLYLNVGDDEVLLDDTLRVAARAADAGVEVVLQVEPGAFHVYPLFVPDAPESKRAIEGIATFFQQHG